MTKLPLHQTHHPPPLPPSSPACSSNPRVPHPCDRHTKQYFLFLFLFLIFSKNTAILPTRFNHPTRHIYRSPQHGQPSISWVPLALQGRRHPMRGRSRAPLIRATNPTPLMPGALEATQRIHLRQAFPRRSDGSSVTARITTLSQNRRWTRGGRHFSSRCRANSSDPCLSNNSSTNFCPLKKTHVERLATAATATAEKDMYPCFVSLPLF
jgi:hypothetical protein